MEQELTEYQKGMIDGICGVIEMILAECDSDMKAVLFDRLKLTQVNP